MTLRDAVRQAKHAAVAAALRASGGNVADAARALGIARSWAYKLRAAMEA